MENSGVNPYAPGAGTPPPELAGREPLLREVEVTFDRARAGLAANSLVLVGLRGVGKTVLLNHLEQRMEASGIFTVVLETSEQQSLPSLLTPSLKAVLLRMSGRAKLEDTAARAWRALRGFAGAMKVRYEGVEFGWDATPEAGLADSGDLTLDLGDLLQAVGEAARARRSALALLWDEFHGVPRAELAPLLQALHRVAQRGLPVVLVAAGLPQIVGRAGRAKTYAERLLDFHEVGSLDARAAGRALRAPAKRQGVSYEAAAVREIVRQTEGYPYFLQEWGKHAWDAASASPITVSDVRVATERARVSLDAGFFRMRFDRVTGMEKRYLRAMAELGPGPHGSGRIAGVLGRKVTSAGPIRASLIRKGMLYSPAYGETAFTVPKFDDYLKRTAPSAPGQPRP